MRTIAIIAVVLGYTIALASERAYLREHSQPSWTSIEQMHAVYVEKFIQSSGFGMGRMGPTDFRDRFELVLNGQPHVVKRVELIGLVKHPEPTAYVTSSIPPQKAFFTNDAARSNYMARLVKTRPLTTFETNALVELRNGRNDVLGTHDGSAAILGAVRAQEKCLNCHDGKMGTLLGAFTYSMALAGKPAVPILTNNPPRTTLASRFGSPVRSAATNLATRITNAAPRFTHHAPRTTNRLSNPF